MPLAEASAYPSAIPLRVILRDGLINGIGVIESVMSRL